MIVKICLVVNENMKIFFVNLSGSIDRASFQIKLQNITIKLVEHRSILHDHYIEIIKIICFNFEYAIYSCDQWLIPCILNVRVVFYHEWLKLLNFTLENGFDDELRIVWEKEKASTFSSTFSGFENLIAVFAKI